VVSLLFFRIDQTPESGIRGGQHLQSGATGAARPPQSPAAQAAARLPQAVRPRQLWPAAHAGPCPKMVEGLITSARSLPGLLSASGWRRPATTSGGRTPVARQEQDQESRASWQSGRPGPATGRSSAESNRAAATAPISRPSHAGKNPFQHNSATSGHSPDQGDHQGRGSSKQGGEIQSGGNCLLGRRNGAVPKPGSASSIEGSCLRTGTPWEGLLLRFRPACRRLGASGVKVNSGGRSLLVERWAATTPAAAWLRRSCCRAWSGCQQPVR